VNGDKIYITPSGVQKEYIDDNDLFVYSFKNNEILTRPNNDCLKLSECTPLFLSCYELRGNV
jgi:ribulose-5-phosphate 4-epimerase/fuculose-1-phosphate aldolase